MKVTFSNDVKLNVPISIAEITGLPFIPKNSIIKLERPESRSLAISFEAWSQCPRIGFFPGTILVLVRPGSAPEFSNWVKERANLFRDSEPVAAAGSENAKEKIENLLLVEAIESHEIAALTRVRELPFVIAATLDAIPYGPPGLLINLPNGTVPNAGCDQSGFEARLVTLFQSAFPRARPSDFKISSDKGTRYTGSIFGPTERFVSGPEYRGTWLKADLLFRFYKSPAGRNAIDRLMLEIPDGFLPRWPTNATEAPLQDHYRQFHLSPEGKSKTEDFSVLEGLQSNLGRAFTRRWQGEVID